MCMGCMYMRCFPTLACIAIYYTTLMLNSTQNMTDLLNDSLPLLLSCWWFSLYF